MKKIKDGDIASLFLKHAAKKNASALPFTAVASALPSIAEVSDLTQEQDGSGTPSLAVGVPLPPDDVATTTAIPPEDVAPAAAVPPEDVTQAAVVPPQPQPPPLVYDPDRLPQDPADRLPIADRLHKVPNGPKWEKGLGAGPERYKKESKTAACGQSWPQHQFEWKTCETVHVSFQPSYKRQNCTTSNK